MADQPVGELGHLEGDVTHALGPGRCMRAAGAPLAQHGIGALVVADPHALGHPLVEAAADLAVPIAWPRAETLYLGSDLALALGDAASESARLIDEWIKSKRI
jgi:hypothetical protein